MKIRHISEDFIKDLKEKTGELNWIYRKVMDAGSPYSLEIRAGYINVYYRGGSLLKIAEKKTKKSRTYTFGFDSKYGKRKGRDKDEICWCDFMIRHQDDMKSLTNEKAREYFDDFRSMMDGWFAEHPKLEREYQHYASLPRYNDNVLDIEYAIGESGMRLDMVMIDKKGELYLIENKFGNSAISSRTTTGKPKPGLSKHYGDFITIILNEDHWTNLTESMQHILDDKKALGMISPDYNLKHGKNGKPVFHFLFVLADLKLPAKSMIIENEKTIINEEYREFIREYPPEVLCVDADQYSLKLDDAQKLMSFCLSDRA